LGWRSQMTIYVYRERKGKRERERGRERESGSSTANLAVVEHDAVVKTIREKFLLTVLPGTIPLIYIYIYIHTYICICTCVYIHMCMYMWGHVNIWDWALSRISDI
jgi:hypothetical protein